MVFSSDIITGLLSRKLSFKRLGNPVSLECIPLPKLAVSSGDGSGQVFVAADPKVLPSIPEYNLIAFVGSLPHDAALPHRCDIICFDYDISLDKVFNALQVCVGSFANWLMDISELSAAGSDVKRMIERSIPIFENSMTVTDYDLRVIGCCSTDRTQEPPLVFMDNTYERVPLDMARHYIDRIPANTRRREPFFFNDPQGHNYCINLFKDDTYIGCCSLSNHAHEIQQFETLLFQMLASYVRRALIAQGGTPDEQIHTMTSIFSRLVKREQVPRSQVEQALELLERTTGGREGRSWRCIVIRNANRFNEMPEGYVTTSIRELIPSSHAFFHENDLVVFTLLRDGDDIGKLRARLGPFLKDMNFRAGVSRPFDDVFSAFPAYRQAACALESGQAADKVQALWTFDETALGYMLVHGIGEFDAEHIIAPELIRLAALGPSDIGLEYIETLRAYLDNNCNGLQTSKTTYLHRSTLAQRIERIREYVNLNSAEHRLYLQMCLHMPGVRWDELRRLA